METPEGSLGNSALDLNSAPVDLHNDSSEVLSSTPSDAFSESARDTRSELNPTADAKPNSNGGLSETNSDASVVQTSDLRQLSSQVSSMEQSFNESWYLIVGKVRIDAFHQAILTDSLKQASKAGYKRIAIDLKATRFIGLSTIQALVAFATELSDQGGLLAFIAPAEKTLRHFEIYGNLKHITIFRDRTMLSISPSRELSNSI